MYYKVLMENGRPKLGKGEWRLPKGKRPGSWMPKLDKIIMCRIGYHVCDSHQLINFLDYGPCIYEAEIRGLHLFDKEKTVASQARLLRQLNWDDTRARLFACDCAERALDLWSKHGEVDIRSKNAVFVARQFAYGKASQYELASARSAAGDAALSAARSAAMYARGYAAMYADMYARGYTEVEWQTNRLLDYLYGRIDI